jgi:hypothetical protein
MSCMWGLERRVTLFESAQICAALGFETNYGLYCKPLPCIAKVNGV